MLRKASTATHSKPLNKQLSKWENKKPSNWEAPLEILRDSAIELASQLCPPEQKVKIPRINSVIKWLISGTEFAVEVFRSTEEARKQSSHSLR